MKYTLFPFLSAMLLLAGCVTTELVPEDYTGPTAIIEDSAVRNSQSQVDFFYLSKVDGQPVQNALRSSRMSSSGGGFNMSIAPVDRQVLPRNAVFEIVGKTAYAAPILAFTNKVYEVTGEVKFTPEERTVYQVKGELGESYSAVWIEEKETGKVIGEKIEIQGSAALNLFQK